MGWIIQATVLVATLSFCSHLANGQYKHKYNVLVDIPQYGKVEGFSLASFERTTPNYRINHFLGIPFARRPSQFRDYRTEFRFKQPERPSWEGIWNASYYRPSCPQHPWYIRQYIPNYNNFNEDCLYMNIYSLNVTDEPQTPNPSLYPVMVFIHGGGYTVGSGQLYPGTMLAQRRMVVVTFNYRLNALGFLSTGDQNSAGNYGMWDQVAALQFVKENIQYFRGNPNKITLFGHSTGASSVGLHLISPRSGNANRHSFFQQAILMSGSDLSEFAVVDPGWHAVEYSRELGKLVGCPITDNYQLVRCLQLSRTPDEIVNASMRVRVKSGTIANPWGPVVDGYIVGSNAFLPDPPRKMREQGRFPRIRVMAGLAKDDGSWFIPNLASLPSGVTANQFENILFEFLQDRGVQDRTVALNALKFQYTYWPKPNEDASRRQMTTDLMSDYLFGSAVNEVLRLHTEYNQTYSYVFNYKSYNDYLPHWRGIAHGQELQYVFGFPFFNQTYLDALGVYPRQRYTFGDTNCSEFMMNIFTNFSTSGNPTSLSFPRLWFYNTTFMQYNLQNHSTFIIQNMSTSYNELNYRQNQYAFWWNYFPKLAHLESSDLRPKYVATTDSTYKTATWSLSAACALVLIICIALMLGFCCRRRKEKDHFGGSSYA